MYAVVGLKRLLAAVYMEGEFSVIGDEGEILR
jgi:hypothetical protein